MGLRRSAAVATATLATLLTAGMAQASAAPPLSVEMSAVKCQDVSKLAALSPLLAEHLVGGTDGRVPHVQITIRSTGADDGAPYTITVDGQTRGQGYVGAHGTVTSGVALDNDATSHITVKSGDTVVVERTVTTHC